MLVKGKKENIKLVRVIKVDRVLIRLINNRALKVKKINPALIRVVAKIKAFIRMTRRKMRAYSPALRKNP